MSSSSSSSSSSDEDSDDSAESFVSVATDSSSIARLARNASNNKKMGKAQQFIHKANEAAKKIQKMFKIFIARKRLKQMCSKAWVKQMDPESGDWFYKKTTTGEIRWDKPTWYVAPEGSIKDAKAPDAASLLKTANERLQFLRKNRKKTESTDWPIVLPSGNRYEGQTGHYGQDKPHGAGVMSYLMGGRYCGEFVNGRRHGSGTMVFPDGSSFEGEWVDDRITGMGVKCETNGTRYEGEWMMDEFQGIGIYLDARGTIYQGEWKDGSRHGHGVEWVFEEASDGRHELLAGAWENNIFLNESPRLCCVPPDPKTMTEQAREGAREVAHKMACKARILVKTVAERRSMANQARRRANDERKRTQLTMDVKRLQGMAVAMKGKSKSIESDPYTAFLETELAASHRKQTAAERKLRQAQRMATLAEQQWTEAASYNSAMANERNVAQGEATRALKWKPTAEARWQNIAEMRDMLLQLRVALHVSKKQERKMDRSTRDALRRAEKLQLKLNKTLSTVQRSTVGKLGRSLSRQKSGGSGSGGGRRSRGSRNRNSRNRGVRESRGSRSHGELPYDYSGDNGGNGGNGGHNGFVSGMAAENRQRFMGSRGAMTSAGSSIMGLTPPGSPDGDGRAVTPGMGYRILPEVAPTGTPLYYSPVRDQHGRAVSPVHPSRRTPSKKTRKDNNNRMKQQGRHRASSPVANAQYTSNTVLDAEWKGWPEQKKSRNSRGGAIVVFE